MRASATPFPLSRPLVYASTCLEPPATPSGPRGSLPFAHTSSQSGNATTRLEADGNTPFRCETSTQSTTRGSFASAFPSPAAPNSLRGGFCILFRSRNSAINFPKSAPKLPCRMQRRVVDACHLVNTMYTTSRAMWTILLQGQGLAWDLCPRSETPDRLGRRRPTERLLTAVFSLIDGRLWTDGAPHRPLPKTPKTACRPETTGRADPGTASEGSSTKQQTLQGSAPSFTVETEDRRWALPVAYRDSVLLPLVSL
ncbi:hypothetical protein IWX90DRAFT_216265 [Phyllosticta citrichinensis]|uniref:Uncharacterized protein n=1 Tax=Phyllosticta citrichinensis TaxID=1130410 RepID=A0ABR1XTL5_9PEZI